VEGLDLVQLLPSFRALHPLRLNHLKISVVQEKEAEMRAQVLCFARTKVKILTLY
jgi:hypothetical protein